VCTTGSPSRLAASIAARACPNSEWRCTASIRAARKWRRSRAQLLVISDEGEVERRQPASRGPERVRTTGQHRDRSVGPGCDEQDVVSAVDERRRLVQGSALRASDEVEGVVEHDGDPHDRSRPAESCRGAAPAG
jgi:hypothetical protein